MITLVFRFPHGRYTATPWGEPRGSVELPPSLWRLLRALYATWRYRLPGLDEAAVHELLGTLAQPPAFDVPRHFVRDGSAVFERDAELAVHWSVDLTGDQHETLSLLARSVPYLGRADSRCQGRVDPEWRPTGHDGWSPVDIADSVAPDTTATALLVPTLPLAVDTLLAIPADVRGRGLPLPAGTRLLGYQRDPRPAPTTRVTAVLFAVAMVDRPPAAAMVAYTDLLRQAALSRLGRLRARPDDTVLGGRTASSDVMDSGHAHAHYLPVLRGDRLDGLLVWAPTGLPDDEFKALTAVRELRGSAWPPLHLRPHGVGAVTDLAPSLTRPARDFVSVTPFTASRHTKRHTDDHLATFFATEIVRELDHRNLPRPTAVTVLHADTAPWLRYRLSAGQRSPQGRGGRPSAFLRLAFADPLRGPLALGHLSHFGLGLFHPTSHTAKS